MKKIWLGVSGAAGALLLPLFAHAQMTTSTIGEDLDSISGLFNQLLQVVIQHWALFLIGLVVVVGAFIFAVRKIEQLFHGKGGKK